ncbi:sulfite exporter TauE/SafE family protein [Luteolibacter arcticus]|uniref:Probable membrane transporter protein n=1 Tax=Luteolibacter arcticus TaxID=1581411 RepID=A0ABT3GR85_9BACT|nr:sulfite exporter TauE/SafE family protein [Luteolibacter arcticus]MCW1926041.1 sulfite exporter TauE/SafE family protein [Luteolibacter arcticus]
MNPLAWLGAALIGLSLGLTGAGGSVITLPVLVYLAGVPPREAVGLSLLVVGAAAAAGAVQCWRAGDLHARAASMFALSGMAGAWFGAKFTRLVAPEFLMVVFAVLMLAVAARMLFSRDEDATLPPECRPWRCLGIGGGTGIMTGFLGVGGGFLLVPALIKFARLPLRMATGTSLAVIAFNSAAGFAAHLDGPVDWKLAGLFSGLAVAGSVAGNAASGMLPVKRLRQGFAVTVLLAGAVVLWRNLA